MKKLTCHCGGIEAEVNVPENGFEKVMRCNCSICKRKGYIIGVVQPDDFKLTKGEEFLTLYQFYTNTAKHYFCKVCGIHTHNRPRSNPKIYGELPIGVQNFSNIRLVFKILVFKNIGYSTEFDFI